MSLIVRVAEADWSANGLPNVLPFIDTGSLEYGFDFRARANRLADLTGKHVLTPKRTDGTVGTFNVTDQSVVGDMDNGLGIYVLQGYLQLNLALAAIPVNGSKQFTVMVVGGYSGVAFPPEKVRSVAPGSAVLFDYGSHVGPSGFAIEQSGISAGNKAVVARVESGGTSLDPGANSGNRQQCVYFLTFDGFNWKLWNKTKGTSAAGTNTSLSVSGNPIAVSTSASQGMVSLGGHLNQTSTVFAAPPSLYQSAMWNRVLTDVEIEEQYQRTRASRPTMAL